MICLDTTVLVDLWRNRRDATHPVRRLLVTHATDVFSVPAPAAGEFLEGAAFISPARLQDAVLFLRPFHIGSIGIDTATHYADVVATLRHRRQLAGSSKADLWIAAWAVQHGARLATRNTRHFRRVPGLELIDYA